MIDKTDWKKFWEEGRTPWDLGGPHLATRYILAEVSKTSKYDFANKHVVIPGAGRAHDASIFLQKKSNVVAYDLSKIACRESERLHSKFSNFSAVAGDYIVAAERAPGAVDVVFDRAMLCALPEPLRKPYINAAANHLRSGGLFITIPFRKFVEKIDGPPFEVSQTEIVELFNEHFDLVLAERSMFDTKIPLIEEEYIYVYRKK